MIRRVTGLLVEVVLAAAALGVVLIGVAVWRLSQGPVAVDFLTPYLERNFSNPAEGIYVAVGSSELVWSGGERDLDLVARRLRIMDEQGEVAATLPSINIKVSLSALAHGVIAPTVIEVHRISLRLLRDEQGQLHFAGHIAEIDDAAIPDLSAIAGPILNRLLQRPNPAEPLSYLRRIEVRAARILMRDQILGATWWAPQADLAFERTPEGMAGHADMQVQIEGETSRLAGTFAFRSRDERLSANLNFSGLHSSALLASLPPLEAYSGFDLPLSGRLRITQKLDDRWPDLDVEVSGGTGRIDTMGLLAAPLEVRSFDLRASLAEAGGLLDVDVLRLALGDEESPGPRITARGTMHRRDGLYQVDVEGEAFNVPADDLDRFWPPNVASSARAWVTANIRHGRAETAHISLAALLPDGLQGPLVIERLDGGYSYRDLEVHYLAPMPPVTGVDGEATFDHTGMTFDVDGGQVGDLEVGESSIRIHGLDTRYHAITIELPIIGPLQSAFNLLDHPRLRLIEQLGLTPEGVEGHSETEVRFEFPLISALTLEDLEIATSAQLTDAVLRGGVLDRDITDARVSVDLDQDGMRVRGPLRLAGVPMDIDWQETFTGTEPRTRVTAQLPHLDESDRLALGLDLAPYLSGTASAAADIVRQSDGLASIAIDADLQGAGLQVEPLAWQKPPGEEATARLRLRLRDDRLEAVEDFAFNAPGLYGEGSAVLTPDGQNLEIFQARELRLGQSQLADVAVRPRPDGGFIVDIARGRLDAARFLNGDASPADDEGAAIDTDDPPAYTPLSVSAPQLERLTVAEGRYLEAVNLQLDRNTEGWQRIVLTADIPRRFWHHDGRDPADAAAAKRLRIDYAPGQEVPYRMTVRSDDMGAALRALDLIDVIEGGALTIDGKLNGPFPASPLEAEIFSDSFRVYRAPALARLLTIASITGLGDLLAGEGLGFERLVGGFTLHDDMIESDLLRAYGPALGITARGRLDLAGTDTQLGGTLVPAYSLNRVLGSIPLLGFLLTGGEGGGVLGVTYSVTGSIDDPQIAVNPLSALAPGFLRMLFEVQPSGDADERAKPDAFPDDASRQ